MGIDPHNPHPPRPPCILYPVPYTHTIYRIQDTGYGWGVCFLCGTGTDRYTLEKNNFT
jgi:hypothetical protein